MGEMPSAFMPHGFCFNWNPALLSLHIISDAVIALAYFSIPVALVYFARKRADLPFGGVFYLFGSFIIFCGMTHIVDIITIWQPIYWISGAIKALTAFISGLTAIAVTKVLPLAMKLQTPTALKRVNDRLAARYQRLLEDTHEGVWMTDRDGRTTYVNARLRTLLGYAMPEILGRRIEEFVDADQAKNTAGLSERFRAVGERSEVIFTRKNGESLFTVIANSELFDEHDACTGMICMLTDVSDRALAEQRLAISEERYRSMADSSPLIVWTAEADGAIDYLNERWQTYSGLDFMRSDRAQRQALIHADDRARCVEAWLHSVASGEVYEVEHRLRRASDGAYRWHLGRAVPQRDAAGQIKKWFGTMTDIDDQKRAFEVQARTTEQLRFVVEASNRIGAARSISEALVTLSDLVVPQFADWTQIRMLEPDGGARTVSINHVDPDRRAAADSLLNEVVENPSAASNFQRAIREHQAVVVPHITPDMYESACLPQYIAAIRKLAPTSGIHAPMLIRGAVIGVFSVYRSSVDKQFTDADLPFFQELAARAAHVYDTSAEDLQRTKLALEDSQSRYLALADAVPQIIWVSDDNGSLEYVNESWIRYTGLNLIESRRLGLGEILLAGDIVHNAEAHAASSTGSASAVEHESEIRLKRADGSFRWHLVRTVPFRDTFSELPKWIVSATDIHDRKTSETALAQTRDEAVAATDAKSRFLATMSHEIRTPMSGVIGMTELLMTTGLTEEQRVYAKVVYDSGRALLRVLNDILDYSKIEAGKFELEQKLFHLSSQVEAVINLLKPQFERKAVAIEFEIAATVYDSLLGDDGRLRQILMNLIGNALKFTPEHGRVRLQVDIEAEDMARQFVRFRITDTGIGMTPKTLARLFQPFSQGDESTTRKFGGTGLGLSISAELVNLMQGQIGVESTEGVGSLFWFTIPFLKSSDAAPTGLNTDGPAASPERPARSERILLVEDNETNTMLAVRQFRRLGFTIATVVNGLEAVAAIAEDSYDMVFMDCHMPVMDGFEATRIIREGELGGNRRVPIVAMTADARSEDREICLSVGMDDYLSKPVDMASLSVLVDRWLPLNVSVS